MFFCVIREVNHALKSPQDSAERFRTSQKRPSECRVQPDKSNENGVEGPERFLESGGTHQ